MRSSGSSRPPAETEDPQTRRLAAWARPPWRAPRSARTKPRRRCSPSSRRYPGARDTAVLPRLAPAMVRTALGIGETSPRRAARGRPRAPDPYAEHALVAANAALAEARGDLSGRRRCLRRRRRSLGAVRGRPRAGVRAPRPGPVPARALPTDRGRTRPAARPRDLRAAPGGPRARRDRRAPAAGHRAQFVGRSGQHLVKEPTEPNGTQRYSCDIRIALTCGCSSGACLTPP